MMAQVSYCPNHPFFHNRSISIQMPFIFIIMTILLLCPLQVAGKMFAPPSNTSSSFPLSSLLSSSFLLPSLNISFASYHFFYILATFYTLGSGILFSFTLLPKQHLYRFNCSRWRWRWHSPSSLVQCTCSSVKYRPVTSHRAVSLHFVKKKIHKPQDTHYMHERSCRRR